MRSEKIILFIGFIIFSVLFFVFYPPTYGIVDEATYLSTAYTFQKGTIFYDQAGMASVPARVVYNAHFISRYAPGNSLLLLPFTLINWKSVFIRGYLLAALGFIIMILLLAHFNLPLVYALLFLFHPAISLYSRTIMSDLPATILVLLAFFMLFKNEPWTAGVIFGAGVTVRYPVLLVPIAVCIILVIHKKLIDIMKLIIGLAIGLLPLAIYHLAGFNTIIGPMQENAIGFSISNIYRMLPQFLISLMILYPLMLVLPFFSKLKEKWLLIAPAIAFLIFFSLQYFIDKGGAFTESIIRGQRYMLPIIPLLLLPYIDAVTKAKILHRLVIPVLILLVAGTAVMFSRHQQFLKQQADYGRILYNTVSSADRLMCNKDIYELVNPYIRYIWWLSFEDRGEIEPHMEFQASSSNIKYLACLARSEKMVSLYKEVLSRYPQKQEIITNDKPYYFAVWKISIEN